MTTGIIYTVLPREVVNGKARVTLFLSPRLSGVKALEDSRLFRNWPIHLIDDQGNWKVRFNIRFSGSDRPVSASPYRENSGPRKTYWPDAGLWQVLFPGDTAVRDFNFNDLSTRRIHSFPAANLKAFVDDRYRQLAVKSPTKPPSLTSLLKDRNLQDISLFRPVQLSDDKEDMTLLIPGGTGKNYAKLAGQATKKLGRKVSANALLMKDLRRHVDEETDRLFHDKVKGKMKAVPPKAPNPRNDFMQFKRFTVQRSDKALDEKVEAPTMDFHALATAYGQQPVLLRMLGLAIDVELAATPPQKEGLIWVEVQPQELQTKAPRTHYLYNPSTTGALGFMSRPKKDSDLNSNCLSLGKSRFSVMHMDVSAAGEKTMNLAASVQNATIHQSADTKPTADVPALQTAGISIARHGSAVSSVEHFEKQRELNQKLVNNDAVELWAEDLVRGYRVDVLDGTSRRWRSLCRRKVTYALSDTGREWAEDYEGNDGWVSLAVTESIENKDNDLYLQESLFRWTGWSLVAPRPGKILSTNYQSVKNESQSAQPLKLGIMAVPSKGSLPRLRFGVSYTLRARAVDLAGNGLTLQEANELDSQAAGGKLKTGDEYVYRRMEPVAQPVVLARDPLTASNGETMERLVIRSYNHKPDLDAVQTDEVSQRHILPPAAAQRTAEYHGQFDDAKGHPQPSAYEAIVGHDDPLPNKDGVYQQESVAPTYLPDPGASGAAFAGLPAGQDAPNRVDAYFHDGKTRSWRIEPPPEKPARVHQVDFGPASGWPDLKSFRIRLQGTQEPLDPVWDFGKRELVVYLMPGELRKVKISSYVEEQILEMFDAWNWLREEKKDAALKASVLAGLHWMLTPFRELTLVHAVQQPLVIPEFTDLKSVRHPGETFATLKDTIPVDGHSTLKIDVHAEWPDITDAGPRPERLIGRSHAFELPVEYEETEADFGPARKLVRWMVNPRNLGIVKRDHKIGLIKPETVKPGKQAIGRSKLMTRDSGAKKVVKQTPLPVGEIKPPVEGLAQSVTERVPSRHEFGDTRYRRVTYTATATTRFLEYLSYFQQFKAFQKEMRQKKSGGTPGGDVVRRWEAQNPEKAFTRRSSPVTIDVMSSARPPAPEVEYVIPTFGWEKSSDADGISSKRYGGGLRVYLKRPWFASGAGELLGVVVGTPPQKLQKSKQKMQPGGVKLRSYLTQWGMDPIWRSPATPTPRGPGLENFRNPAKIESNLSLDELPGARVSVAGYDVGIWDEQGRLTGFDEQRQLWYCDIEIDPGQSYFPFVRLVLARYQPNSISWKGDKPGDVKLSRVVLADFAQLAPDRFASVTFTSATEIKVSVTGHTYLVSGADKYAPRKTENRQKLSRTVSPKTETRDRNTTTVATGANRVSLQEEKGGSTMEISLETLPAGLGETAFWEPVPGSIVQLEHNKRQNSWAGRVALSGPRGTARYRLVIREYEWFLQDLQLGSTRKEMSNSITKRLVYTDVLEI